MAKPLIKSGYGDYLMEIINEKFNFNEKDLTQQVLVTLDLIFKNDLLIEKIHTHIFNQLILTNNISYCSRMKKIKNRLGKPGASKIADEINKNFKLIS